jgi:hypothetical protein
LQTAVAQKTSTAVTYPYDRQEEIIYQNKRYAIHNNYMTFAAGLLNSNLHIGAQRVIGADVVFHIREQHFQAGGMISGPDYFGTSNLQAHFGYGYRLEKRRWQFAAFGGPAYCYGVRTLSDTAGVVYPEKYWGWGVYGSVQGILKLAYDIGVGLEFFGELGPQRTAGFRIVVFFSGAYRGLAKNYNPHVRAENPGK